MTIRLLNTVFYHHMTTIFFHLMMESGFVRMIKYLTAPNKMTCNFPHFLEEEKYSAKLPLRR